MTPELFLSMAVFCFVSSITPGPNNMMLMSSGMNFGFRRTLPHMLGVAIGFVVMVFAVGLGLGALFQTLPLLYLAMKIVSVAYLLYLAWRLANAGPVGDGRAASGQPLTFMQAAAFQWVNPKAWFMGVTAVAAYAPKEAFLLNVAIVTLTFGVINLPCISTWVVFGEALRRLLRDERYLRAVNVAMGLALAASVYPILGDFWPGSAGH